MEGHQCHNSNYQNVNASHDANHRGKTPSPPFSPGSPKACRRDHAQISPRAAGQPHHRRQEQHYYSTPPPQVKTSGVAPSYEDLASANSTGLTPLAAQLRLAGGSGGYGQDALPPPALNPFSLVLQQQQQQEQAVAQIQLQMYQKQHYQQTFINPSGPLGAGVAQLRQPQQTQQQNAPAAPHQHQYHAQKNISSYRDTVVDALSSIIPISRPQEPPPPPPQRAAAKPTIDPTWPYAPGIPIVQSSNPSLPQPPINSTTASLAPKSEQEQKHSYGLRSITAKLSSAISSSSLSSPVTPLPQQTKAGSSPASPPAMRRGINPATALRSMGHILTQYEKAEIVKYSEIWYVGRVNTLKISGSVRNGLNNAGYSDRRGEYNAVISDHIAYRYEILGTLGRGSFGQVLKCLDHATGQMVALKIIRNKTKFQQQAQVEASMLLTLRSKDRHNGIVKIIDSFSFRTHLCITFEMLQANLYEHIKAGGYRGIHLTMVRWIAVQLLHTLVLLKGNNIIHCDLKPENILLVRRGSFDVKLIDFGSSCFQDRRVYTYIQSRFYRAPEVIVGVAYGCPIDMWSLACVLAELLTGNPLFPGENEGEQIACIAEILGNPPISFLRGSLRGYLFFDEATGALLLVRPNSHNIVHRVNGISLEAALRNKAPPVFIDFLKRCLQWDPAKRMTPSEALQHPWITNNNNQQEQQQQHHRLGPLASAAASQKRV